MLYRQLADHLQELIRDYIFGVGTWIPAIRQLSRQHKVSACHRLNATCRGRAKAGLQCKVSQDDVLITNSCQEAMVIVLNLLTRP